MNHPVLVGILHAHRDLLDQAGGPPGGQGALGQFMGQAPAFDETHREVVLSFMLADLVDRHDPGMIQAGGRLGFRVESPDLDIVGELTGKDHLERDGPVEAHLPGMEDHAHAAPGDLAQDLVVAERAAASRRSRIGSE